MPTKLTPEQWKILGRLFERALGLPPEERQSLFDEVNQESPHLLIELKSLLSSHEEAGDFLESPAVPSLESGAAGSLKAGAALGDFVLMRSLGKGAFAEVFLARQISLDRIVALKVSADEGHEARTMAPLEHDNIVRVFSESSDSQRKLRWICMQYVAGAPLENLLEEIWRTPPALLNGKKFLELIEQINPHYAGEEVFASTSIPNLWEDRQTLKTFDYEETVLWLGLKLSNALAHAHKRGVLHLDMKPANILLTPFGRPLITDFNVSLNQNNVREARRTLGGTFAYMSPEQKTAFENFHTDKNSPLDGRADLFSLGLVLKKLLEKGGVKINQPPVTDLDAILTRCCDPDPNLRYSGAEEFSEVIKGNLELRKIQKRLPRLGIVAKSAWEWPLLSTAFFVTVPEIAASVVNISYNALWIVSHLTASQQALFQKLVILYNLIVYPICFLALWRQFWPVRKLLVASASEIHFWGSKTRAQYRRHVIYLLPKVMTIITAGWILGSFVFPFALHFFEGPIESGVFIHFFVSFSLSWLVALAYSSAYVQFLCLRILYPHVLRGEGSPLQLAREEANKTWIRFPAFHALASLIPLVGAILILIFGTPSLESSQFPLFRVLLASLILMGASGLFICLGSILKVERILDTLDLHD